MADPPVCRTRHRILLPDGTFDAADNGTASSVAPGSILHPGGRGTLSFFDSPPAAADRAFGGASLYRASLDSCVWLSAGPWGCHSSISAGLFSGYGADRSCSGAENSGCCISILNNPVCPLRDGAGNGWICGCPAVAFPLSAAHFVASGRNFQPGAAEPFADRRNHPGSGRGCVTGGPFPGPDPLALQPGHQAAV